MDVGVQGAVLAGCGASKLFTACVLTGMALKRLLVVFDFGLVFSPIIVVVIMVLIASVRSTADQDIDRWVFEANDPCLRWKMREQESTVQWTGLV